MSFLQSLKEKVSCVLSLFLGKPKDGMEGTNLSLLMQNQLTIQKYLVWSRKFSATSGMTSSIDDKVNLANLLGIQQQWMKLSGHIST